MSLTETVGAVLLCWSLAGWIVCCLTPGWHPKDWLK